MGHIYRLVQERRNSIANALELRLYCTNPLIYRKFAAWFFFLSRFLGGAGEACSHMAEGLATALQLFDDLSSIREPRWVILKVHEGSMEKKLTLYMMS